jgi:hypothetical protein
MPSATSSMLLQAQELPQGRNALRKNAPNYLAVVTIAAIVLGIR